VTAATIDGTLRDGEAAYQAARRRMRLLSLGSCALLVLALVVAAQVSEFKASSLAAGAPRIGEYFQRILPTLEWRHLFAGTQTDGSIAAWMYRLDAWALLLFETAQMAALATLMGCVGGLMMAFPAARNITPGPILFQFSRRLLEAQRTVPEIVVALIFVWAFGIGALAGILAIAIHTTGALGKLFAEAMENADLKPWEGVRSAGGTWFEACRFAILPQALPNIVSYAMLRFEVNLRSASVIGFVGAGGIGEELYKVISFNYYEEISAIIFLIILAVAAIDLASERLRHRAMGALEAQR
jgi:phosphonate transport system permease protein